MNRKGIVKRVIQERRLRDIVFLLWYGDRKGKDVDLLVVLKDGVQLGLYEMTRWDILEVDSEDFEKRLRLFDPVITEPVITGSLLLGDLEKFTCFKKNLLSTYPSISIISFLLRRACEELENAAVFLERYQQKAESQLLLFALLDLSFACSYFGFAEYYKGNLWSGPISFSELLTQSNNPTLRKVVLTFKQTKSGRKINETKVSSLIQEVRKIIKGD